MNIIARCLLVVLAFLAGPAFAALDCSTAKWTDTGGWAPLHSPGPFATPQAACDRIAAQMATRTFELVPGTSVCVGTRASDGNVQAHLLLNACEFSGAAPVGGGSGEPAPTVNVGTVTVSLPDSWTDSQSVADRFLDMSLLWGLFFGAAIVIVCIRKFANIWDRAPHGEN